MATDTHDPLHDALSGLRDDLDRVPLAPADAVRRRGDQRTRRRRVGAGALAVAAVAAVAVLTGQLGDPDAAPRRVPPAAPTSSPSAAASTPASRPTVTLTPAAPGGGSVPAAYFLPGPLWQGPELDVGHAMQSVEPTETEGSITRFQCDPDTNILGDVAFLQVRDATTKALVATQKVRLLSSPDEAATFDAAMAQALSDCQDRLRTQAQQDAASAPAGQPAPTPTATVERQAAAAVDDATGSVRVFRTTTDYGTGAGSQVTEWVVLAREGAAVTFLSLPQLGDSSVSLAGLQRLAEQAREQIRWAASR